MHNDPAKHASGSERNHVNHVHNVDDRRKKRNFAGFLIESDIKPFMFVGKCIQYFGWGTVAGVFLGAICVYGYAVFYKPLPYAKVVAEPIVQPTPPPVVNPPTPVQLHGFVTDADNKPFTESFFIAILAKQHGPEQNPTGWYTMEVPQNGCYDMAFWKLEGVVNRRENLCPEKDGSGYRLDLRMPNDTRAAVQSSRSGSLAAVKQNGRSQFGGQ